MISANPQPVRVAMLRGAQATMPREVFVSTVHVFRNHLDAADFAAQLEVPA